MEDNNRKVKLEDAMYNSDGTFKPFVGHHGNISGEIEDYRNIYMEAERNYFTSLLYNEEVRNYIKDLLYNYSADELFDEAMNLQERLEYGMIESEQEVAKMNLMSPRGKRAISS